MNKTKWGAIQILSGGAYFGAEKAFASDAAWVIGYPGFDAANERIPLEYFQKKGKKIPYFVWDRQPLDLDIRSDQQYIASQYYDTKDPGNELFNLMKGTDVVIAVPFCSALSMASGTQDENKRGSEGIQNNNLKFITDYTLGVIKPKAYIFENAPALYTNRGKGVRDILDAAAEKWGYSITYVKTNTNVHSNVQYRQRTFAIFWQWPDGKKCPPPKIGFYNDPKTDVIEFLSKIPANATHNDKIEDDCGKVSVLKSPLYQFMVHKYGVPGYRHILEQNKSDIGLGYHIITHGLYDECLEFMLKNPPQCAPAVETFKRWKSKVDMGMGYWDYSPNYYGNKKMPTVYFKTVPRNIHASEERGYTIREYMTLMGYPFDCDWPEGLDDFIHRIGQNVPVQTMADWCTEINNVVQNWDIKRKDFAGTENTYYHDNLKPPTEKKVGFNF